jgi:hypothetical protein
MHAHGINILKLRGTNRYSSKSLLFRSWTLRVASIHDDAQQRQAYMSTESRGDPPDLHYYTVKVVGKLHVSCLSTNAVNSATQTTIGVGVLIGSAASP